MNKTTTGFTIIELLIVIVVVAILATISVVAYNGIQNRAADSMSQAEVNQVYKQGKLHAVEGATEEDDLEYLNTHFKVSPGNYKEDEQYPLVVEFRMLGRGTVSYDVYAFSKSGKIFAATDSTGSVTRLDTDWSSVSNGTQLCAVSVIYAFDRETNLWIIPPNRVCIS
jgi:prepilin-type N-terminal cleavage/methylation domain-containing protein